MRVVSLVPSLTEAVAVTVPGALVGATDWCSHPADLDVVRIGGTKNPDVDAVVRLAPDLVVANEEENREPDLTALREAGIEVLVTEVRDVPGSPAGTGPGAPRVRCARPSALAGRGGGRVGGHARPGTPYDRDRAGLAAALDGAGP